MFRKAVLLVFITSFSMIKNACSQSVNPLDPKFDYTNLFKLKKLTFHEPAFNLKWIRINNDIDNNFKSGLHETIVWDQQSLNPAAYVSACKAKISCLLELNCIPTIGNDFYAFANGSNGYNFPPIKLVSQGNNYYLYPITECVKEFPINFIQFYDKFRLSWTIVEKNNNIEIRRINIGYTENQLYVTKGFPILGLIFPQDQYSETFVHHSTIHLSCKNAIDKSDDDEIVSKIYDEFTDRNVQKLNGTKPMQYWGPGIFNLFPGCRPVSGLYKYENATCGTWAYLMADMIRIQGISGSDVSIVDWNYSLNSIQIDDFDLDKANFFLNDVDLISCKLIDDTNNGFYAGLLVNNWNLINEKFVMSEMDAVRMPITPEYSILISNGKFIPWVEEDGALAQGNNDPLSEFDNHAIIKYNGEYYDPSYGSIIAGNANLWESTALSGFEGRCEYKRMESSMEKIHYISWIAEKNHSGQQCNVQP